MPCMLANVKIVSYLRITKATAKSAKFSLEAYIFDVFNLKIITPFRKVS